MLNSLEKKPKFKPFSGNSAYWENPIGIDPRRKSQISPTIVRSIRCSRRSRMSPFAAHICNNSTIHWCADRQTRQHPRQRVMELNFDNFQLILSPKISKQIKFQYCLKIRLIVLKSSLLDKIYLRLIYFPWWSKQHEYTVVANPLHLWTSIYLIDFLLKYIGKIFLGDHKFVQL